MVGRRTFDQEVASSIPGQARLRNDSGQVVHTQLPRRRHSSLVYTCRVVKLGTFTFLEFCSDSDIKHFMFTSQVMKLMTAGYCLYFQFHYYAKFLMHAKI